MTDTLKREFVGITDEALDDLRYGRFNGAAVVDLVSRQPGYSSCPGGIM